ALGEALERWREVVPPEVRLINVYGPTETTISVTSADLSGDSSAPGRVSIGRPMPGVRVYVLDRRGEPALVGAAGELAIGGGTLARGYLDAPGATADAFRPDPFCGQPGARLYRSGDRARFASNGQLEVLGRLDRQIKLRGFRIEPGEVEAVLAACPGVRAAVVMARQTAAGPALAAWVASARPIEEVVAAAAERLPKPLRPSLWAAVDRFETTTSGKVDLRQLPSPAPLASTTGRGGERSVEEETLAVLWQQVLGGEEPGPDDDFFALGGHSLLAARLIPRVREAFGVEMPLSDLFEAPTLRAQAIRLTERLRQPLRPSPPPLAPATDRRRLSAGQRALWFVDRLDPGSPAYGISSAIRLEGDLDPLALRTAWSALAERHEVLRTRFPEEDGEPVARPLAPPSPESWPLIDLGALASPAADREARRLAGAESRFRFDLAGAGPLRVLLLRHGDRRWDLLVNVHHIATDGTSMTILFADLQRLYGDLAAGRRPTLEPLPLQYGDYAAWEKRWLDRPDVAGPLLESWRARLGGELPKLALPVDRPAGSDATPGVAESGDTGASRSRGGVVPLAVSREQLSPVLAAAAERGATPFVAFLAAWKLYLAQLTGERDLRVGTPVSVRPARVLEQVVGLFANTLVLRTSLDDDPTFLAAVDRVRGTAIAAWAARELPYERLVAALRPDRAAGAAPLYEVWFVLQDEPPRLAIPGLSAELLVTDVAPPAKFDLALNLTLHDGALRGFVEHDPARISETTARRLAAGYVDLLSAIAADPARPLSELAAQISEEERSTRAARRRGFESALRSGLATRRAVVITNSTPEEPES
ncbi:MAG: condensation domain-containing protein, partial [Acidobacteriota bacterium]